MLQNNTEKKNSIEIDGFRWVGNDRKMVNKKRRSGSGGVGILINNDLYIKYAISIVDDSFDGILCMKFQDKASEYSFIVTSMYLPPENSMYGRDAQPFYSHLLGLLYSNSNVDAFYIAGDVNGRIGNRSDYIPEVDPLAPRTSIDGTVNNHGEALLDFCNDSKMCIINGRICPLNDNFTSISTKGLAVVDYFFTRHDDIHNVSYFEVLTMSSALERLGVSGTAVSPTKVSDHSMIVMEICPYIVDCENDCTCTLPPCHCTPHTRTPSSDRPSNTNRPSRPPTNTCNPLPTRFNIKNVPGDFLSSPNARQSLIEIIEKIENDRQIKESIDEVYTSICELYCNEMASYFKKRDATPLSKKKHKNTTKAWWDDELSHLWKEMHNAELSYIKTKRNKLPHKHFHQEFKSKQDLFDKVYKRKKRSYLRSQTLHLENINSTDPTAFWEYIKRLGPNKKTNIPWECYDDGGNIVTNADYILEKWRTEFSHLYSPFDDISDEQKRFKEEIITNNETRETEQSFNSNNSSLNAEITPEEVSKAVKKAKCSKSPGLDGMVYDVLKNDMSVSLLTKLFNLCFKFRRVPDAWVQALIYPLPKSPTNDPRVPLNYRGISLLSAVSKLYTSTLNIRLSKFAEENELIVNEQNGFRGNRSCLDHIFVLHDILRIRKQLNSHTFCAFIDFKKAFDFVDRDFLLHKLQQLGIDGNFYFSIKALYSNTRSRVQVNDKVTEWFPVDRGVRQGDSLSPTLFSLYLNDLAVSIKAMNKGVNVGGKNISILLYADDIVLLAPTENKLQEMLNHVNSWCNTWGMKINSTKTQILHVRNHQRPRSSFVFSCGDAKLLYTETYKYLGYTIHEFLINEENVAVLTSSASRSAGRIINMFRKLKNMGIKTYESLYKSYVLPIMNYGSGVWGFAGYTKPQTLQNRLSRFYLGVHRFAPVSATKIEMNWLDPREGRWIEMLRYYNKIMQMNDDRLPKIIYKWDKSLNMETWAYEIEHIIKKVGYDTAVLGVETVDLEHAYNILLSQNQSSWRREAEMKPKLRTFIKIHNYSESQSLVQTPVTRPQRSLLSQFKLGILPLKIETDRYQGIKPENRICKICNLNLPEDELHFIFKCPALSDIRSSLMSQLNFSNVNFSSDLYIQNLKSMFHKDNISLCAIYIQRLYKKRQELIYV